MKSAKIYSGMNSKAAGTYKHHHVTNSQSLSIFSPAAG